MLTASILVLTWMMFIVASGLIVKRAESRLEILWITTAAFAVIAMLIFVSWGSAVIASPQAPSENLLPVLIVGILLTATSIGTYLRYKNLYGTPSS